MSNAVQMNLGAGKPTNKVEASAHAKHGVSDVAELMELDKSAVVRLAEIVNIPDAEGRAYFVAFLRARQAACRRGRPWQHQFELRKPVLFKARHAELAKAGRGLIRAIDNLQAIDPDAPDPELQWLATLVSQKVGASEKLAGVKKGRPKRPFNDEFELFVWSLVHLIKSYGGDATFNRHHQSGSMVDLLVELAAYLPIIPAKERWKWDKLERLCRVRTKATLS